MEVYLFLLLYLLYIIEMYCIVALSIFTVTCIVFVCFALVPAVY